MRAATRVVSFAPATNSPGKKDATGAFLPERMLFVRSMQGLGAKSIEHTFDNQLAFPKRRSGVLSALASSKNYDVVAFFCHGWSRGIQAGFEIPQAATLAEAIANGAKSDDVTVVLYCCSTGADPKGQPRTAAGTGENSFADRLRDELCKLGVVDSRVVAHTVAAHTTQNPFVLFFEGMGSSVGGTGGIAPVLKGRPLWGTWRTRLKESELRFTFPLMEIAEIHQALAANDNRVS